MSGETGGKKFELRIVSDIHYAGAGERARGQFDWSVVPHPLTRLLGRLYYRHVWLADPLAHNGLLDRFIAESARASFVVANGDYTCDSAFIGVSDDAACASVGECLGKLRQSFAGRFQATIGDHELGKRNLLGGAGAMPLASWHRTTGELGVQPFWRVELGNYVLLGVASSLAALPVYEADTHERERAEWRRLREEHFTAIRDAFASLKPHQRVLLFCHDPSALPFLWRDEAVRARLAQVEQTIIGHLHTRLVFWKSRLLAGMPRINFLGHSARRMSTALNEAKCWRHFNVRLCPATAGVELLKDGGYLSARLDLEARQSAEFRFHPLPR